MPSVDGFGRDLGALNEQRLASFVADLWAARGWTTTVTPTGGVRAEANAEQLDIAVVAGGSLRDRLAGPESLSDADVVVDARGSDRVLDAASDAGIEYVGPSALERQLLYAVPRSDAEAIVTRYFDRPIDPSGSDDESVTDTISANSLGTIAVVVLLVVGLVAAVWGGLPGAISGSDGSDRLGPGVSTARPAAGNGPGPGGGTPTPDPAPTGSSVGPSGSYPPGVTPDGVTSAYRLAVAHRDRLVAGEFALSWRFDGPASAVGFADYRSLRSNITFVRLTEFRINATFVREGARGRSRYGAYANGTHVFTRYDTPNETTYRFQETNRNVVDTYRMSQADLVRRYLSSNRTSVRRLEADWGTVYKVVALEPPVGLNESATDYRAEALVTPGGRVIRLTVSYRIPAGEVRVGFETERFGTVEVSPPDWRDRARNATAL